MLHYAKAAKLNSIYNQLTLIWNRFHYTLRRDLSEPKVSTTMQRFLEDIDAKTSIWYEMADRQADRQASYQRQQQSSGTASHRQQYTNRGGHNGNNKPPPRTPAGDKSRQVYLVESAQDTPYGYHLDEAEEDFEEEDEMPVN